MSDPYIGEIRMFGGNFAPSGWALCDGQLLPISENDALFTLIGTTYGGDGQETFALPNLQSRVPIHQGQGPGLTSRVMGEAVGVESVTLTTQQVPLHTHAVTANAGADNGNQNSPAGNLPAKSFNVVPYITDSPTGFFNAGALSPVGGGQPHDNMQPFLCINFIISLYGIFPSQA